MYWRTFVLCFVNNQYSTTTSRRNHISKVITYEKEYGRVGIQRGIILSYFTQYKPFQLDWGKHFVFYKPQRFW